MAKLSDHELLAHIAMRTDDMVALLQIIAGTLNKAVIDSQVQAPNPSLWAIAGDLHLLRRKLVGPSMSDPEER